MKTVHLIVSPNDDALGHYIGAHNAGTKPCVILRCSERLMLGGSWEEITAFFENELPILQAKIRAIAAEYDEIVVELGYSMTMLFAAYYAVLASSNVRVSLHTPPAFGGDTLYAKTHPHLIQKLIYNVLLKAAKVTVPTRKSCDTVAEVYPRLGAPNFEVQALGLPDQFMPIYEYVRGGLAIFADFEPNGGIDRAIQALLKIVRINPAIGNMPITILGSGDHQQAGNIAAAFPAWHIVLNPPISRYVEAACQSEIVLMPDDPPHAGPTKGLFAAIGAGAAIVAHPDSAARDYAGAGAVLFGTDGEPVLSLANALLRASADPATTFGMMAATVRQRDALRSAVPALATSADLGSTLTEAETCQDNASAAAR